MTWPKGRRWPWSPPRAGLVIFRDRLLCPPREVAPSLRLIKRLFSGERLDLSDGVRVDWPDRWLLARRATSEPVIRLTAEAPTEDGARSLRQPDRLQ